MNYGQVENVDWAVHREGLERAPNPIRYLYLKAEAKFGAERELRITLSAIGVGQFVLADGSLIEFPKALHADFDYRAALADGTIAQILCDPSGDADALLEELEKVGVRPAPGSDVTSVSP